MYAPSGISITLQDNLKFYIYKRQIRSSGLLFILDDRHPDRKRYAKNENAALYNSVSLRAEQFNERETETDCKNKKTQNI